MSEKDQVMEKTADTAKRGSYHHGDLRAQLIEATRQLVEEKGPDRFSVSEACRVAGVSSAAPYKHFKDKGEMLREVAMAGMKRQHQQMVDALAPYPRGSFDRIIALGRVYISFAVKEPGVFRLMFGLSEDHDEHMELVDCGKQTAGVVDQEVAYCRGHDEVEPEDMRRAFLLWSFVHGLSFLQIDGKLHKMDVQLDLEATLVDIANRVLKDPA